MMDYVQAVSSTGSDGNLVTSYNRKCPAVSSRFYIGGATDTGLASLTLDNSIKETSASRSTIKVNYRVTEGSPYINTQYEEREYALKVTLKSEADNAAGNTGDDGSQNDASMQDAISFPEGTQIYFNGTPLQQLDDSTVIIPIKKALTGSFEIRTTLYGWNTVSNVTSGSGIELEAELYSSSVASYYNSIDTGLRGSTSVSFASTGSAASSYSLSATIPEEGMSTTNRILSDGGTLNALVKTVGGSDNEQVSVKLYQYMAGKSGGSYSRLNTSQVFKSIETEITPASADATDPNWTPVISDTAESGTYRLEFTYGDKTDYLDFIIQ
jgi:hypothetical protein